MLEWVIFLFMIMTTEDILKAHRSPTPSKWRRNAERRRRFKYVRHIKNYILIKLLDLKDLIFHE